MCRRVVAPESGRHRLCNGKQSGGIPVTIKTLILSSAIAIGAGLAAPSTVFAHCDSLDGPVVKAAAKALENRDVNYALIWVQPDGEAEVRAAFTQALAVRALSAQAQALADRYFFETLVRIHRAGEGAAFTGLKPAGLDFGPAIAAADRALSEGSQKSLAGFLDAALSAALHQHFVEVAETRNYDSGDLAAGRRFVKAYVEYIHYVERLHEAISAPLQGHFTEAPPR